MIDALVKFGVKDQNVVLSTMDKITKKKKELVKKTNITFGAKDKTGPAALGAKTGMFGGLAAGLNALKGTALEASRAQRNENQQSKLDEAKEKFENNKFVKSAKAAGDALQTVARGAATLDPVAFIQSTLSAAGKVAGGVPFVGGAAQGSLELAGVGVGAAAGAVGTAKQSSANAYALRKRNQQNNLYGGNLAFGDELAQRQKVEQTNAAKIAKQEAYDAKQNLGALKKITGGATSNTAQALRDSLFAQASVSSTDKSTGWTPAEKTQLIQTLGSTFGRVQKPLADVLNKFIAEGKNVEQFTQVAGGNWEALGTDEGAILQQISNSFAGALPSIKQELQKELLKTHGGKIEKMDESAAVAQKITAAWERQGERQELRKAAVSAEEQVFKTLVKLDSQLNDVQIRMIANVSRLADAVSHALSIISG